MTEGNKHFCNKNSRKGKTQSELFTEIVAQFKLSNPKEMSNKEANRSARNFIGFCNKMIEINIRLENEQK